jgi:rhodanese-related sulfurtransferase
MFYEKCHDFLWGSNLFLTQVKTNKYLNLKLIIMKKRSFVTFVMLLAIYVSFSSFKGIHETQPVSDPTPADEFEVLLNYLETNRNFINSEAAPALVPAAEVKKNLKNDKYHIIDIRSASWFEYGHVKNAANVVPAELLSYFENSITPTDYDKIVLVCYSGQSAAYYSSLLRIAGYDNVHSMNYGMSSWRVDFAENSWLKNTSSDFEGKTETAANAKGAKGATPQLNTGKTDGEAILRARLEKAFATPYKESIAKSADVFANPADLYIVDYNSSDRYNKAHIPQAVNYEPRTSLSSASDLLTLPADKKIVVCGATGQDAAYVVAYLDILGYDASNIAYGANSFMHKTLKDNNWEAFTKKDVNMYPVIE